MEFLAAGEASIQRLYSDLLQAIKKIKKIKKYGFSIEITIISASEVGLPNPTSGY